MLPCYHAADRKQVEASAVVSHAQRLGLAEFVEAFLPHPLPLPSDSSTNTSGVADAGTGGRRLASSGGVSSTSKKDRQL